MSSKEPQFINSPHLTQDLNFPIVNFLQNSDKQRSLGKLSFSSRDIESYTRRDLWQKSSQSLFL